jgi:hypothetical protein
MCSKFIESDLPAALSLQEISDRLGLLDEDP